MNKILICLTLIISTSAFAKKKNDYSDYIDSRPLDRSVYHDRSDSREVKKYNPSATCSDFKRNLVAKTFGLETVSCTTPGGPVNERIHFIEVSDRWEVVKVVKNHEIFYYFKGL